jgi:hypothetical protein
MLSSKNTILDGSLAEGDLAVTNGSIIQGNASGVGAELAAGGSGKILVGDGTDLASVAVSGDATLAAGGALTIAADSVERSMMAQEALELYSIPLYTLRAADGDALAIAEPASQAGDHYLVYSSGSWVLRGISPNSTTETDKSLFTFSLPPEYDDGQTITVRIGAKFTADGDAKTIDLEAFKVTALTGAVGSDICATEAITLTGTAAACDFTVTPTGLTGGDILSFIITTVFQDADGTTGEAEIGSVAVMLDITG